MKKRIKFKPYNQNQVMLFPPSLTDMIPNEHPVRVVSKVIDEINIDALLKKYKHDGCPGYHPRMMLKVLIYGYLNNIYSSRKIESAVRENIYFMWLAGMEQPDHNTINRFRSDRLKGVIKKVFTEVVLLLAESGHVDLQSVYTDGTKIDANANRYTFVWSKNIKRNKERILQQLEELWKYTLSVASEELKDTSPTEFAAMNPDDVRKTIDQINEALKDKPVSREIKEKIRHGKKNWPDKLKEYEEKERILGDRNSYSKTDPGSTFMRMKDDHLNNGELRPAYNVQISTSNQMIANYSTHFNPNDTRTLIPHLDSFMQEYGFYPRSVTADAGYGSEENYEFMESNGIEAFVKYSSFDKEQSNPEKSKPVFHPDNLYYNEINNCYYCPMGQRMEFVGNSREKNESGFIRNMSRYRAQNCEGCQIRGACHKSNNNREIDVSHRLNELKSKARERLLSDVGIEHRRQRSIDVESVFGNIKQNKGFRRFLLRGQEKINVEFGLLAIAHNLKKVASFLFFLLLAIFNAFYLKNRRNTIAYCKNLNNCI